MTIPLLKAEFSVPPARLDRVPCPRLIGQLHEGLRLERKLTLLSAPAGYGKTTLVSDWIIRSPLQAAWLSLDELDNAPSRFWNYLVAALSQIRSNISTDLEPILRTSVDPPIELLPTTLVNSIAVSDPLFALVFDDYHVINQESIHKTVAFVVENQPPQMHLIPLDDRREWYRYHRLFADYLQSQLSSAEAALRHSRAATWYEGEGLIEEAERLLGRLLPVLRTSGQTGAPIEALGLQALLHDVQGDETTAVAALQKALALAKPGGYVRTFVDLGPEMATLLERVTFHDPKYVGQLLAACGRESALEARSSKAIDLPAESLNEREQQILRLLAAGLSNPEIAEELYLARNTIKWYLKGIYGKLDVHSRIQIKLVEGESNMKSANHLTQLIGIVVTFALLLAAGIGMTVGSGNLKGFEQSVLMQMGSALVSGSLAFFLIEMFRWNRE